MSEWAFSDESGESVRRVLASGVYESTTIGNIGGYVPAPYVKSTAHTVGAMVARLCAIDAESVRPLRAKLAGTATEFDTEKLASLDAEAVSIRSAIKDMTIDIDR